MTIYGLFDADEYELPICYAMTLNGLAYKTGIPRSTLYASLAYGRPIQKKYKVEKISVYDFDFA